MGWTAEQTLALVVRKRDGRAADFDRDRIDGAIEKAFRAELNLANRQPLPPEIAADIASIVDQVYELAAKLSSDSARPHAAMNVEQIQDTVEIGLMQRGHFRVARCYILYRTEHARIRAVRGEEGALDSMDVAPSPESRINVELEPGVRVPFDRERLIRFLDQCPEAHMPEVDTGEIIAEVIRGSFDGMTPNDITRALVLAARSRIERDPAYDALAAQLQRWIIYRQALGRSQFADNFTDLYRDQFEHYIIEGIRCGRLAEELRRFDLVKLASALLPERDAKFRYLGLQTIYDRYLLHKDGRRIETPQYFWMRVAMGLALAEGDQCNQRAIEFYQLLSSFRFTSATPTLFNSGTPHPQLSSCYLTTVQDDLEHIFKCVGDNAMLSKWAGGLGNDWTNIRATGARIRGTNGESQGVIPFLKIVNDAAVAVNQGGKRKGAVCAYMEPWHLDFEEFLDLRKNTGDDRRRTHDMHTAAWIPDLFMQRLRDGQSWTLFSPDDVPDLHDTFGQAFQTRYEQYEADADAGKIRLHRVVAAVDLWRKLLTRLFETGHPWVTFKDPSNIRSPQDHVGVVHSSNLCTEILLNTSREETAVCNLGSINLGDHIVNNRLDLDRLRTTIQTAMRMLDNVIDINYYPTVEAENANRRHRPVGLGVMGYQDALHQLGVPMESDEAVEFADTSMEAISYFALLASSELAAQRGQYESYSGSKWDRGLLPIDTLDALESQRGETIEVDRNTTLDWSVVRKSIAEHGMRNSNCLAIAPTATISTIVGATQSIEPTYKQLYSKSNLSGEFTQVNVALVDALKSRGLWNAEMVDALKYYDGAIGSIATIPEDLRRLFATAFEIQPAWLIAAAARRQKWIDQGQSLNLYLAQPSGKAIDEMYQSAWRQGLKTTYYMRSLAATQVEKSTVDVNRYGIQPRWMKSQSESSGIQVDRSDRAGGNESDAITQDRQPAEVCDVNNPDCEACQ
ncbi:ribonucleoside-diphosphate reductase subunit alpha [Allorhodopirellula solitaria]|uniref:Ribonucleoside-diphosphate reductase n=1 Tax=Allorhodopirellula solitaria TaxID=2527987 RepID=A0A5C5XS74_9BACT|nr:ribonucleoside-diphosphate reductase subunit alpha [Allorhodopirellula solitaria]TWT65371.1 Ribonucleoside-diphosphate reductase 1 subunit alpha [Allorhodopirellula solitaria]